MKTKTFAEQLRAERKRLNLSQEEAASLFVDSMKAPLLPVATWREWEYGRRNPPPLLQHFMLHFLARQKPDKDGSWDKRGRPPLKD